MECYFFGTERLDGGDYLYRLYGSTFVNQFKVDMTGKRVNELPEKQAELLRSEYDAVVHSGIPMSRRYTATFDYTSRDKRSTWQVERSWERLALPLTTTTPNNPHGLSESELAYARKEGFIQ